MNESESGTTRIGRRLLRPCRFRVSPPSSFRASRSDDRGSRLMLSPSRLSRTRSFPTIPTPHEQMGILLSGRLEFTVGGVTRLLGPERHRGIPGGVRSPSAAPRRAGCRHRYLPSDSRRLPVMPECGMPRMREPMARVVVIGSSNTDMTVRLPSLPTPGQTLWARPSRPRPAARAPTRRSPHGGPGPRLSS